MVCTRRLGLRFEFVEEVQGIASFVEGAVDLAGKKRGEERPVVSEAMATVEVCEASRCSGESIRKCWGGEVSESAYADDMSQ